MVPVRLGSYSTMQRHSFVMPGAELGEGAVLFEESQVLKGETVPPNEIWSGNPAEATRIRRPRLWAVTPKKPGAVAPVGITAGAPADERHDLRDPLLRV